MSEIFLRNGWICPLDNGGFKPRFADLRIADGRIVQILPAGTTPGDGDTLDAAGRVVTAPLVNFHEHTYSRLAKGLPVVSTGAGFVRILEDLWWRLDRALDADMIRAGAELAAMEAIAAGVTCIFDHHASPGAVDGSLGIIADVFREFGMRGVLCHEISDRNGEGCIRDTLAEHQRFLVRQTDSDIQAQLGLHAPFTLSDDTLAAVRKFQANEALGIHVHVAEDAHENRFSLERYGKTALRRLTDHGLLNDRSIVAHGVHLTDEDHALLTGAKCGLASCPESNMNNAVGLLDLSRVQASTALLAGTDGMHGSIARTLKLLFLLRRHQRAGAEEAFAWFARVLTHQQHFARRFFPDPPALSLNARADFVVWDYVPPAPLHAGNALGHYLYGVLEARPATVVHGGRVLLREFQLTIPDESRRRARIALQGARLSMRFADLNP